jgi:hypothetical protein
MMKLIVTFHTSAHVPKNDNSDEDRNNVSEVPTELKSTVLRSMQHFANKVLLHFNNFH